MSNATTNNENKDKKQYEDTKIVVLDGKNRKLDMSDKLEKSSNFRRPITDKSKLQLTICDYTNKDKGGSITVKFNFTPDEIAEFDFIMKQKGDFSKLFDRIYNAPDKAGLSPLKKMTISRHALMPDKKPSSYPVYISVENGRAKCIVKPNGTTTYASETYVCDAKADIRLSNADARTLFRESNEYVERMKMIYAMELRAGNVPNDKCENAEKGVTQKEFVDCVNRLHKALSENITKQTEEVLKEIKDLKSEIMFGKE